MAEKTEIESALEAVAGNALHEAINLPNGGCVIFHAGRNGGLDPFIVDPLTPRLPQFVNETIELGTLKALIDYTNRFKNETTTVFVNTARKFLWLILIIIISVIQHTYTEAPFPTTANMRQNMKFHIVLIF